ncbi:MAG TPA: cytochrome oxidase small assembly protein [Burkholderiales bacterium]|nr:cytochrome oxidase small assembly protein [Burkholderiales bacterium]
MDDQQVKLQKARILRTGLILASVALAFFVGIILRRWT